MRKLTALLAAMIVTAVLTPLAASADVTYVPTEDTLFAVGTGCGGEVDLWLSASTSPDDFDGCGTIGGLPVSEALPSSRTMTTRDGMPIVLDASREITVQVQAECWVCPAPGAGQSVVEVSLSGKTAGSFQSVFSASETSEVVTAGTTEVVHTFTFSLPASADKVELSSLTLDVTVRGANVGYNNLGISGDTFVTMPTFDVIEG